MESRAGIYSLSDKTRVGAISFLLMFSIHPSCLLLLFKTDQQIGPWTTSQETVCLFVKCISLVSTFVHCEEWQGFFCRRRDRFDPVVCTSLIYPPIVSPSNGRILSKLALFERQWMATLSVGREEMYTQPVSAERIRPIVRKNHGLVQ